MMVMAIIVRVSFMMMMMMMAIMVRVSLMMMMAKDKVVHSVFDCTARSFVVMVMVILYDHSRRLWCRRNGRWWWVIASIWNSWVCWRMAGISHRCRWIRRWEGIIKIWLLAVRIHRSNIASLPVFSLWWRLFLKKTCFYVVSMLTSLHI